MDMEDFELDFEGGSVEAVLDSARGCVNMSKIESIDSENDVLVANDVDDCTGELNGN